MATYDAHKNFAASLVATAPSPAASGTSLVVTAAEGVNFPAVSFNATVWPTGARPTKTNSEIVRVTNIATDTFTITRTQEGTSARTIVVGDNISANITAKTITDLETAFNGIVNGRLTLTSGTPVTTADVTGAATVYFTPYGGNRISLYDGTSWQLYTFSEISLGLGTITNDLPYDVFVYNNSGTLTLEFLAWTSKTARATALVLQDGVWSKTGALTRRYLGTFHTTATTTTEDSARRRLLYNYYNRRPRKWERLATTVSWNYTTATVHQANAEVLNQVEFVNGVAEDAIHLSLGTGVTNTLATTNTTAGIGEDSTTTATPEVAIFMEPGTAIITMTGSFTKVPSIGYHYYAWLEWSVAAGTTTWYGAQSGIGMLQTGGLRGTVWA